MTYDFYGAWDKVIPSDEEKYLSRFPTSATSNSGIRGEKQRG